MASIGRMFLIESTLLSSNKNYYSLDLHSVRLFLRVVNVISCIGYFIFVNLYFVFC